jgi:hypothetical protein
MPRPQSLGWKSTVTPHLGSCASRCLKPRRLGRRNGRERLRRWVIHTERQARIHSINQANKKFWVQQTGRAVH